MLVNRIDEVNSDEKRHNFSGKLRRSLSSSMLRSFIRTNDMRAYHLDLHAYRRGQEFSGDADYVDSLDESHQLRCDKHLYQYYTLISSFAHSDPMDEGTPIEALKLADLYGKPPSGLLDGNQFWLGSYDNCLEHTLNSQLDNEEHIKSQYCLGVAQFPSWNARDTKTSIKVGLCLPESCSNYMLNQESFRGTLNDTSRIELVEQMMRLTFGAQATGGNHPFGKLKLRSIYCLPHETSQARTLDLSAKLLVLVLASFVVTVIYATICDYFNGKLAREASELVSKRLHDGNRRSKRQIIIESFSLIRNIEKLFITKSRGDDAATSISQEEQDAVLSDSSFKFNPRIFSDSMTGLKSLGLLWIIGAHTFLVSPIPDSNLISMDKVTKTLLANIFLSAHLMVDTFFALSGILASYLMFKFGKANLTNPRSWIVLTIHRYWRLTPVYILCYWFAKSLSHQLNSGPLWDFATSAQSPRFNCQQESWMDAIFHLSDFKSPKEHCVPFAWFIGNGIKFWIITPLLLLVIHKSMRFGYQLIMAILVANVLLVGKLAFSSNVDMKSVIEFKPESAENMLNNMDQVYTRPYSRVGAYLVGLLAGHYFYLIESKQIEVNLSKNMKLFLWTLYSIMTIALTFVMKLADSLPVDDSMLPYIFAICSALIRPLWALSSCWLLFALAHGQARWLARFLSADLFKIIFRLSFCAYLMQGEVMAHIFLAPSQSIRSSYGDFITRPIVAIVLTLVASVVGVLFVEYPLIGIEQLILPPKERVGQKVPAENDKSLTSQEGTSDKKEDLAQSKHTICADSPNGKLKEL